MLVRQKSGKQVNIHRIGYQAFVFDFMKRSSSEGLVDGDGVVKNSKKQKQSSLFDSMNGGSSQKKETIDGVWKGFGDPEKGLKPLLYFSPKEMKGID